ncbi:translocation protein TolB [Chryseosolibacter indicus]|uniref:Translocation protein TolB n=1 Tax=Chryseosolibacter indicus TaxID=2782351 RepID=A0ABS5VLX6_9BACT|nr:translocation protein TolB [Chryseosolibacter indicus]MBT1702008.1 translocation protein TolB [Chryseosolibacter indicus]
MFFRRGIFTALILTILTASISKGQYAQETFGKNRIQYRQFNWQYLSGENFDVYYYDARKVVAQNALEFLESEFDRITDLIGYPPYFKTKVFIYNSLSDLRQSNVGLNRNLYTVNGETEFIKPYVEVANMGTVQEFKEELLLRISELMVDEMMFGGSLKDIFQSSILMNLPDWFIDGASLYVAKGWSAEMDDYMRQLMRTRKAKKITRLSDKEAALAGQSVWNFIAEKYGKSSVGNILNYTRITRNEEKSIQITLGVSFKQLINEWHKYYAEQEKKVSESYVIPSDSTSFIRHQNKTTVYTTVKISPDGKYIAYAENDRGRYIVKVRSLSSGRERTIISGGSKVIKQRVDYRQPLINWADANTLGVIGVKHGEYVFWLYDLSTRSKIPRELDRFSNVRSLNFSDNGRLAILSADFEGRNDLFLVSSRRDRVRRLTNDLYDDLDPSFIPGTNRIVFSSNRTSDSLRTATTPEFAQMKDTYNLFVFDLDTTKTTVARVTNTVSKDSEPLAIDNDNFYYLSDQRGIVNLFKYNRTNGIYSQITNFSTSIIGYDINFNNNTFAYVANKNMKQRVFVDRGFNASRQVFTPATRRKELQQARVIREKRKQEENKNMSIKDLLNARLKESQQQQDTATTPSTPVKPQVPDSLSATQPDTVITNTNPVDTTKNTGVVNTDNYQFEESAKKENVVSTDNYKFEDDVVKQNQPSESFLTRYMKAREKSKILGPFPYETKFSADNLVTSLVMDPLRGLGILLETQMNDMLENYRFNGGIMTTLDLRQGDVFAEFEYLPRFIDFSARFDRKAVRWETYEGDKVYKYTLHRLEIGASFPFTDRMRLTFKPFGQIASSVSLGERPFPLNPPSADPTNHYYGGFKSELVYDNSVSTGMNLMEGTRGKISFTHTQGIDNAEYSFSRASIDLRHYQQIYKEIVFAVRGFAGTFFGNSPKKFLLGGMNNWLFNKTYYKGVTSEGQANPLGIEGETQDILFVEYATNLRGFDYGTLFGNSAMLLNAELRIPLVRALTNGPVASNFFRNLQFVGFYDIGTSWSGKPPFTEGTSVSYDVINQAPFSARIKNYLNPWLQSYGVGVRTVVFSYYLKFDFAWPIEDYEVGKPRGFLTLGFDF